MSAARPLKPRDIPLQESPPISTVRVTIPPEAKEQFVVGQVVVVEPASNNTSSVLTGMPELDQSVKVSGKDNFGAAAHGGEPEHVARVMGGVKSVGVTVSGERNMAIGVSFSSGIGEDPVARRLRLALEMMNKKDM
jgi:hypothetical protein